MKKLILTAAIVCAAVISQGAEMKWGTGKIYKPKTDGTGDLSTSVAKTTVTAYLFEITGTDYEKLIAADYATAAKNVFDAYATVNGKTFTVTGADQSDTLLNTTASSKTFTDSTTFAKGETAYAAMILKYSDANGQDWYIANIASWNFEEDASKQLLNFGTKEFNDTANASISKWTKASASDVPEPTSAMLLLLGVAGLALRRRRA